MTHDMNVGAVRTLGIHLTPDDVAAEIYEATRPGRTWGRVHRAVGWQARVLATVAQCSPARLNRLVNKWVTRR
jgi:hypothetical protein